MQDPVLIAVLLAAVVPVASFAAGGLFAAWLLHRARANKSPLPTLPGRRPPREKGDPAEAAPQAPRRSSP